ncbi:hypothetical protein ASE74_15815 [Pedobacter sp. Leaf216]|uniref:hypothetical protein n=1 Tax=Pedobacter sp. Leaf216 TaxID=1735684 RepID=UPI0007004657|nr:hypothetical protein [Pedobacter sp. Leaf216]KQM77865.1 hypothetical protein ASE74_15815 [Pedobacter sp. Leaf216]
MRQYDFFYSALRIQVLSACKIETLCITDCKEISIKIFAKDRNYLSETTIKRFFGVLKDTADASPFVLDSLAIFTGYTGWEDFKQQNKTNKVCNDTVTNPEQVKARELERIMKLHKIEFRNPKHKL